MTSALPFVPSRRAKSKIGFAVENYAMRNPSPPFCIICVSAAASFLSARNAKNPTLRKERSGWGTRKGNGHARHGEVVQQRERIRVYRTRGRPRRFRALLGHRRRQIQNASRR